MPFQEDVQMHMNDIHVAGVEMSRMECRMVQPSELMFVSTCPHEFVMCSFKLSKLKLENTLRLKEQKN